MQNILNILMFRIFIVLRRLGRAPGAQHRPHMGPKGDPKSAQIPVSDWPGVSLFRLRCRTALEERFWTALGPLLGPFGADLGPSWALLGPILGPFGAYLGPSWAPLGPLWGHLGPFWGPASDGSGHLGPAWRNARSDE